jgi:hypothetical protein
MQVWGRQAKVYEPNTFIGGIGTTENTASLLAFRLGIPESAIKFFNVIGNNISAYIDGYWSPQQSAFRQKADLVYFYDLSEKGINVFADVRLFQQGSAFVNLKYIYLKNTTYISDYSFLFTKTLLNIFLEKVTELGVTQTIRDTNVRNLRLPALTVFSGNSMFADTNRLSSRKRLYVPMLNITMAQSSYNNIFGTVISGLIIYTHPDMATANGGNPHPSIVNAISQGAIIRYVTSFVPPSNISDLSVSTITATTAVINFTPPASINGIDFYEIWLDDGTGKLEQKYFPWQQELTASGQTITGLTPATTYRLRLCAIDNFYNGAGQSDTPAFSNEIIFATL